MRARFFGRRRGGLLPLWPIVARPGGNAASACFLLMGTMLALTPQAAPAQQTAAEQIRQAVERRVGRDVRQEAARQGWKDLSVNQDVGLPGNVSNLPPCPARLQLTSRGNPDPLSERQRFEVTCPGDNGWAVTIVNQVSIQVSAVHTQGVVERGQILGADDLKLERTNMSALRRGFYAQPDEVVGMAATRRLRANQPLTPALVATPPAVRRGQLVKVVASHDGIEASTVGEALSDGQPGEIIRVRNVSSEKTIHAKVVEPGVVTSTF